MQNGLAKFSLALHDTSFSLAVLLLTIAANQTARENSGSYCKKKKKEKKILNNDLKNFH